MSDGKIHEFNNNGDYIEVTKLNVKGQVFINDFVEAPYPTEIIYFKECVTFPGTVDRHLVYYINEDDELCRIKIGEKALYILAKGITHIEGNLSGNEVYAYYTDENFFEKNIYEKDSYEHVIYKKVQ